jgi:DNA-binding CsgD family transcriptional regulator
MPVAIGVVGPDGVIAAVAGGLSHVINGAGEMAVTLDPQRVGSWRVLDKDGRELPLNEWPGPRAMRGETIGTSLVAIHTSGEGEIRTLRVTAKPRKGGGYIFLLQDADTERAALEQVQEHLEQGFIDTMRRVLGGFRRSANGSDEDDEAVPAQVAPAEGHAASPGITNREHEVLRLFAWGYSRKEVAARLGIAVKTAEFYQASGMRKLGLRNRIDVVSYAIDSGWMATKP